MYLVWKAGSKFFVFQLTLRERRFGLIEILDEKIEKSIEGNCCQPATIPATLENVSEPGIAVSSSLMTNFWRIKQCWVFDQLCKLLGVDHLISPSGAFSNLLLSKWRKENKKKIVQIFYWVYQFLGPTHIWW